MTIFRRYLWKVSITEYFSEIRIAIHAKLAGRVWLTAPFHGHSIDTTTRAWLPVYRVFVLAAYWSSKLPVDFVSLFRSLSEGAIFASFACAVQALFVTLLTINFVFMNYITNTCSYFRTIILRTRATVILFHHAFFVVFFLVYLLQFLLVARLRLLKAELFKNFQPCLKLNSEYR